MGDKPGPPASEILKVSGFIEEDACLELGEPSKHSSGTPSLLRNGWWGTHIIGGNEGLVCGQVEGHAKTCLLSERINSFIFKSILFG